MTDTRRTTALLVLFFLGLSGYVGWTLHPYHRGEGPTHRPESDAVRGRVVHVFDGDTLRVRLPDGAEVTVRLQNVECPETRANENCRGDARRGGWSCARQRPAGLRARRALREKLEGATVTVRADASRRNTDDRRLARLETSEGDDVGEWLVDQGLCRRWRDDPPRGSHPPY